LYNLYCASFTTKNVLCIPSVCLNVKVVSEWFLDGANERKHKPVFELFVLYCVMVAGLATTGLGHGERRCFK